MDDRTVQLHRDDWQRIKRILNAAGASTGAIDRAIDSGEQRPKITRSWDWWTALIDKLGKTEYGLVVRIIGQCSQSGVSKPEPKPLPHEVATAKAYLDQEDDSVVPDLTEIDETA